MARISLNHSTRDVFITYNESFKNDRIYFKGKLKEEYRNTKPFKIIEFISGGRKYAGYDITIKDTLLEGYIEYEPYVPSTEEVDINMLVETLNLEPPMKVRPNNKKKFDKKVINTIRTLYENGIEQKEIAGVYGVSQQLISNVINHKGAYKE